MKKRTEEAIMRQPFQKIPPLKVFLVSKAKIHAANDSPDKARPNVARSASTIDGRGDASIWVKSLILFATYSRELGEFGILCGLEIGNKIFLENLEAPTTSSGL